MSTVDAYKFYTTLLFSIKSKVISYATKCNLASTVDINNKVVSYRQTIQSNSAEVRRVTTEFSLIFNAPDISHWSLLEGFF